MGDDSFGVSPANDSAISNILAQYALKANNFLAVNVRVGFYAEEHNSYLQRIAELIDKISGRLRAPILIVPISLTPDLDSDVETGVALRQLVKTGHVSVMENNNLTPTLVKGILGKAIGAVGVSYHFCTFAICQGIPAVCIHAVVLTRKKREGFVSFWEDRRLALCLENLNIDLAVDHIIQVLTDDNLRQNLSLLGKQTFERWSSIFDRQVKDGFLKLGRRYLYRSLFTGLIEL